MSSQFLQAERWLGGGFSRVTEQQPLVLAAENGAARRRSGCLRLVHLD
jgi:hypothetical protein